jgi:hypothetical protein
MKERWSISISGNWRITFEFRDGYAYNLDYEEYHFALWRAKQSSKLDEVQHIDFAAT